MHSQQKQEAPILDPITGVPGRAAGTELLYAACEKVGINNVSAIAIEITRFGQINSSVGNKFADKILKLTANRLRKTFPYALCLYRTHGDQFCMLLERSNDIGFELEKLSDFIQRPFAVNGNVVVLTIRAGVAQHTHQFETPDQLIYSAELALHQAKGSIDPISFYDKAMIKKAKSKHQIANDLRVALVQNASEIYSGELFDEFQLEYQPIIAADTNKIMGFEALLRWHHPEFGLISPFLFIPIAEDIGIMDTLGRWVIRRACKELAQWNTGRASDELFVMSVNVSPTQFQHTSTLLGAVNIALSESDIPCHCLKLEITESEAYADTMKDTLHELKALGCLVSLDDFGTGYSSIGRLIELPIDYVKIDRSFVKKLDSKDGQKAKISKKVAEAVYALANALNLHVITEGIETPAQLEIVKSLGAVLIQGYLFSKPLPRIDVPQFIKDLK